MGHKIGVALLAAALLAGQAGAIGRAKVVEPLAAGLVGAAQVVGTTVTIGDKARASADKLDARAAKRASAPSGDAAAGRPAPDGYAALPLTAMLPLEVEDAAKLWGLTHGRAIRLAIAIDSVRVPDALTSTLIGVTDELAGTVAVTDAATGDRLGAFKVLVVEGHGGAIGLATRGSGLREKLAADFADHVAKQLSGSKHKPKPA